MALTDKNIVITPNIGSSTADPTIVFSGASSVLGPQNVTLTALPINGGTVAFSGSAGQLLTISNSFTGTIFSANDVSGIPSIEVLDTGLIKLGQYSGNILLGTGTDNATDKLQVNGSIIGTQLKSTVATGTAPFVVSSTTPVANLSIGGTATALQTPRTINGVNFDGTSNIQIQGSYGYSAVLSLPNPTAAAWYKVYTGSASATNVRLAISCVGDNTQIYDEFDIALAGYTFKHQIVKKPSAAYNASKLLEVHTNTVSSTVVEIWISIDAISSISGTLTVLSNYPIPTLVASAAPTWTGNFADLLIGGGSDSSYSLQISSGVAALGDIRASTFTSIVATGTAPFTVSSTTPVANLSIGGNAATATNVAGGVAGSVHYQSGVGVTGFTSAGTSGQILVSGGTGSPTWTSTPSVSTLTSTIATGTAPFTVTSTTPVANLSIGGSSGSVYAGGNTLTSSGFNMTYTPSSFYSATSAGSDGLIRFINTFSTPVNKYIRLSSASNLEIVNSANTSVIFSVSDAGVVTGQNVVSNSLASASTTINVSSASAPTIGQVLTATSSTAAVWSTPVLSLSWTTISTNTNAVAGSNYFVNTSVGQVTVTLPAGTAQATINIVDYTGTFGTYNCIIVPNGTDKINNVNARMVISTSWASTTLVYIDATVGWRAF